jgi:hypothetical protein
LAPTRTPALQRRGEPGRAVHEQVLRHSDATRWQGAREVLGRQDQSAHGHGARLVRVYDGHGEQGAQLLERRTEETDRHCAHVAQFSQAQGVHACRVQSVPYWSQACHACQRVQPLDGPCLHARRSCSCLRQPRHAPRLALLPRTYVAHHVQWSRLPIQVPDSLDGEQSAIPLGEVGDHVLLHWP